MRSEVQIANWSVVKEGGRAASQPSWLMKMDRETAGIPGLLPLVLDLPVRFTQEPARGDSKERFLAKK